MAANVATRSAVAKEAPPKPLLASAAAVAPDELAGLGAAFLVKAAVYERGLAAGVGIKPLDRARLRLQMTKPGGREALRERVQQRLAEALDEAGVCNGQDGAAIEEAVEVFLNGLAEKGEAPMVSRRVAQGEAPEPGRPPRFEYPLNPDNRGMGEALGLGPHSRRRWMRIVHQGDTLVRLVPGQPGKPGRGVRGEKIELAVEARELALTSLMGGNVVVEADRLVAGCEGACEENAAGRVRVIPEVAVNAVDAQSGNLPEAGVGQTSVWVRRDIRSGYMVATTGVAFVGSEGGEAAVEDGARVTAHDLIVRGRLLGKPADSPGGSEGWPLQVEEWAVATEMSGASLVAGRILVTGSSRFARMDADESLRVDGDLIGGVTICRQRLWVGGDLGTAMGGSRTRLIVPQEQGNPRRKKQRALALHSHQKLAGEIQQKLSKLDDQASKRAQAEPYWAALLGGEERPPSNPLEAKAQRRFLDFTNDRKRLAHALEEVRRSLKLLQREDEEETAAVQQPITVAVQGHFYLDATVETVTEVREPELGAAVSYAIDGKRFRGHSLQDLRALLAKQARDYQQNQGGAVEERRQAIEAMYEEAEKKPTGPKLAARRFEQVFSWGNGEEEAGPVQVQVTAFVDSQNAGKLWIRSVASLRQAQEHVELAVSQEGARTVLAVGAALSTRAWADDPEVRTGLDSIAFRGVSATDFLQGEVPPETG